jgi:FKBP-type peptidyl-prolyl cis-trans isomerase FklB
MKYALILSVLISFALFGVAQPGKPPAKSVKPAVTVKPPVPLLKNADDSANYALGISLAGLCKSQGITKVNSALFNKAFNETLAGKKLLMDAEEANKVMTAYISRIHSEKSKPRIQEGEKFLAQNKAKPGVKTTPSGLQYEVITEGTGIKPTAVTDSVTCHYRGNFLDGSTFDESYSRGEPITFALNGVITGWTEGLQLMSVGSKYKLYVPYTLGYGPYDYMSIPGGSLLIFEIELLDVKKK